MAPADPTGNDDLDVDGNWAVGGGGSSSDHDGEPASTTKAPKKGLKKRKRAADDQEADGDAPAPAAQAAAAAPVAKDKKAKKKRKRPNAAAFAAQLVVEGDGLQQACARVQHAWDAQCKADKLTPIERSEVQPVQEWFLNCDPSTQLADLPRQACAKEINALKAAAAGKRWKPATAGVGVLVLCSSAERVFEVCQELDLSWGSKKAVPLCAAGGGRRSDQVKRQAEALAEGSHVMVATPGRLLRIVTDGTALPGIGALVLDLQLDQKKRDVLTLNEARKDVLALLRGHVLPSLASGATKLALCGLRES